MKSFSTKDTLSNSDLHFPCIMFNAVCDSFKVNKTPYGYNVKNSLIMKSFKTLEEVRNFIDEY